MKLFIEIDLQPNMEQLLIDKINEYCQDWFGKKPVLKQYDVIGGADILPLADEVKSEVKRLWALPSDYNNPPKVAAVKLVMQYYRDNGVECGIKKAKEVIEQHCL